MKFLLRHSFLLGLIACTVLFILVVSYIFFPPFFRSHQPLDIPVYSKSTAREIAKELKEKGVITLSTPFRALAKMTRVDRVLKAGLYQISPSMSLWEVLTTLSEGKSELLTLRIPEGYTAQQIGEELEKMGVVSTAQFLNAVQDKTLIQKTGIHGPSLEGFLFPQTYRVPLGASVADLADLMSQQFFQTVGTDYESRCRQHGLSLYQAVILASIVEKEAKLPEEHAIIAGVLYNRLQQNMRLEVNATLNYILNSKNPWFTNDQINTRSPFNTYKHRGLPPTPICNPGITSLEAVVDPADVPYLYYVAQGDGSHLFATTLAEHEKNVKRARYLRHLKRIHQQAAPAQSTPKP